MSMTHQGITPQERRESDDWGYETSLKHWRRYGSWFSWGSPIGLGLFCIAIAITLWILGQAFGWN